MSYDLQKLTPNLIVADVQRSIDFYRDVLEFTMAQTVPDQSPFVFAIMQRGGVEVFLNAPEPARAEYPALAARDIGGTLTLFMNVKGIRHAHEQLKNRVNVVMPLEKKWYGVTEFAFTDPDGYVITFAEVES
jgi:uncharacterized glyoxalase superfamily protein PhnB